MYRVDAVIFEARGDLVAAGMMHRAADRETEKAEMLERLAQHARDRDDRRRRCPWSWLSRLFVWDNGQIDMAIIPLADKMLVDRLAVTDFVRVAVKAVALIKSAYPSHASELHRAMVRLLQAIGANS